MAWELDFLLHYSWLLLEICLIRNDILDFLVVPFGRCNPRWNCGFSSKALEDRWVQGGQDGFRGVFLGNFSSTAILAFELKRMVFP
jgi:hypothetical protein